MSFPIVLGKTKLPNKVFYAPLAGCSDLPFRKMACRYRPGIVYCEMVKIDALIRHDTSTYRLLDYEADMHPIGAQLCGSKPKFAGAAAKIIEDLGFDVLDFNCGCPVDKVTKDGSGSGMLKTPELIGEMIYHMVNAVKIPVTVKIRAGWDDDTIIAKEVTKIAERAGAKAITIHGRTREQGYKGKANRDYIRECKEVAKDILVIGNGDIFDAESALDMFSYTNCDAILVARGTMGQPWIVQDILRKMEGETKRERGVDHVKRALFEHFEYIVAYQPEKQSLLDMRRVGCWYLKKLNGVKELRNSVHKAGSTVEVFKMLENFEWDAVQFNQDPIFAESEC